MPKNIVLLSDGTGNSAAKLFRTNVWRVYESLDLSTKDQIAYYHDGVGSSPYAFLAAIGGAFGWGLKRSVLDLYRYLSQHYDVGDHIYVFGFSRGAFTIRVLIGLIAHQGILPKGLSTRDLRRHAASAYRQYRKGYRTRFQVEAPFRWVRDCVLAARDWLMQPGYAGVQPHRLRDGGLTFAGLWDTVDAYGLPIDELKDGVDRFVWPLSFPDTKPSPIIRRGCHALSLDDERQTFHPVLWDETGESEHDQSAENIHEERITQVWFAGVHANVGGGYADDRLSIMALRWMLREACSLGLKLKVLEDHERLLTGQADPLGHLYDSRAGVGGYYRYCPRAVMVGDYLPVLTSCTKRFKIHESVFTRLKGDSGYAPIVLPREYAVVHEDGTIVDGDRVTEPTGASREHRWRVQQQCWDLVWWKRVAYFATLLMTAVLLLLPAGLGPRHLPNVGIALAALVGLLGSFLPSFAAPVVTYYRNNPLELMMVGGAILALMRAGTLLQRAITDRMRTAWFPLEAKPAGLHPRILDFVVHDAVRALRTWRVYRATFAFMSRHGVPVMVGAAVLSLAVVLVNRAVFEYFSSRGRFCVADAAKAEVVGETPTSETFLPKDLCHPTSMLVIGDTRYRLDVVLPTEPSGWFDASTAVRDPSGISPASDGLSIGQRLAYVAAIPARRIFRANVLTPIARIGSTGADHYVLSAPCTVVTARKNGVLFLFANDVVVPFRWDFSRRGFELGWSAYYANNSGAAATVIVSKLPLGAAIPTECREDVGM